MQFLTLAPNFSGGGSWPPWPGLLEPVNQFCFQWSRSLVLAGETLAT